MSMEENHQEIDDNDDDIDAVQHVKLVSAEGYEFFVDRQIAISSSTTIRTMLSGSFLEGKENIIRLPDMAGYILERLVRYMHYKAQYSNSTSRIPEFVSRFTFTTTVAGRRVAITILSHATMSEVKSKRTSLFLSF